MPTASMPEHRRPIFEAIHLVWGAAWRAQASHLAIFALLPVIAAGVRLLLGLVLLPVLIVGFGDRQADGPTEMSHLRQPGCWVALAPCPAASMALFPLRRQVADPASGGPREGDVEPFFPLPSDFNLRHAWLVVWLVWFAWFLVRRDVARRRH
jgi:hypothetical protein